MEKILRLTDWGIGETTQKVLVPFSLPGENLELGPLEKRQGRLWALDWKLLGAAPQRVTPRCSQAGICPGCALQHLQYAEQVRFKTEQLRAKLRKFLEHHFLSIASTMGDPIVTPAENIWEYRTRVSFHLGWADEKFSFGYTADKPPFALVPIQSCHLAPPIFSEIAQALVEHLKLTGQASFFQTPASLKIRQVGGPKTPIYVELTLPPALYRLWQKQPPQFPPPLATLHWTFWSKEGLDSPHFNLGKVQPKLEAYPTDQGHLPVAPHGFTQVNTQGFSALLKQVGVWVGSMGLAKGACLLELYAGSGLFSFYVRPYFSRFFSADLTRPLRLKQIEDQAELFTPYLAFRQSQENRQTLVDLHQKIPAHFKDTVWPADSVLLANPPRGGLGKPVVRYLNSQAFPNVIYISCNPNSLFLDLSQLAKNYRPKQIQAYDLFPHTPHFETCVWLQKI